MDLETVVALIVALSLPAWLVGEHLVEWTRSRRQLDTKDVLARETGAAPARAGGSPVGPPVVAKPLSKAA